LRIVIAAFLDSFWENQLKAYIGKGVTNQFAIFLLCQRIRDNMRYLKIPTYIIPVKWIFVIVFSRMSNCSGSSWRSGAQAPYRSRLGWSAGAFGHVLSSHTGSFLLY